MAVAECRFDADLEPACTKHDMTQQHAVSSLPAGSAFFMPVDYDPRDGSITAGFGIRRTGNRRAVQAVLWLANRHMLPRRVTTTIAERLGWTYRGESR